VSTREVYRLLALGVQRPSRTQNLDPARVYRDNSHRDVDDWLTEHGQLDRDQTRRELIALVQARAFASLTV
jgi:hypothetical protein